MTDIDTSTEGVREAHFAMLIANLKLASNFIRVKCPDGKDVADALDQCVAQVGAPPEQPDAVREAERRVIDISALPDDWFLYCIQEDCTKITFKGDTYEPTGFWICELQHRAGGRLKLACEKSPQAAFDKALAAARGAGGGE